MPENRIVFDEDAIYAHAEFIYVWWCCVREVSSNSENAEEAPRVPPRNTTPTRL
jgi:hypothetical protein